MKRFILWSGTVLVLLLAGVLFTACTAPKGPAAKPEQSPFEVLQKNEYDSSLFYEEGGFIRYEDAMVGIDVSAHQDEIDWGKVKADGVDFAIIRAAYRGYTNGGISMDPYFLQNLQGAKDAGLLVGAYLFSQAVSEEEAREEAEFLLECLDGAELDLPVYYDWEPVEAEARTDGVSGTEVTAFAREFCSVVEEAGYEAGVYFNESMGYMFLYLPELQQYEFWLAQYLDAPDFYYNFTTWQYTASGEVDGIEAPVDLNLRFVR